MKKLISVLFLLSVVSFGFMQIAATLDPAALSGDECCDGHYYENLFGTDPLDTYAAEFCGNSDYGMLATECGDLWRNGYYSCSRCAYYGEWDAQKCIDNGSHSTVGDWKSNNGCSDICSFGESNSSCWNGYSTSCNAYLATTIGVPSLSVTWDGGVGEEYPHLYWNTATDAAAYKVYRNGALIATVTGTSYDDHEVWNRGDISFVYQVRGYNSNIYGSGSNTVTLYGSINW